jgi:mannobiose 2-epimerase
MVDPNHGGFFGRMDGQGILHPDADKGVVLNARILWAFSASSREAFPEYAPAAERAFDYLLEKFRDPVHGGYFWMLDASGQPVNTRKQVYAQAFVIYGLSEYYRLNGDPKALEEAQAVFSLLEQLVYDPVQTGYFEAFSREWVLLEDLRLSAKDANEKKTMNTHLHVLEAYANLYRVWPVPQLAGALRRLIDNFMDHILNPETQHLILFSDENWKSKSRIVSFGHDIEASWLLFEAASVLGESGVLAKVREVSQRIASTTWTQGRDADGSIFNEIHEDGNLDREKVWWVQAEAMVGFLYAWNQSGDARYRSAAEQCWQFIQKHLLDATHGEWYWSVDDHGKPNRTDDLAGPWKCPYHTSRACLEGMRLIE